jgi:hypothetical protein
VLCRLDRVCDEPREMIGEGGGTEREDVPYRAL